jgi:2-polyprenyl-3-methyl-5-hydroxy-6-metoxy-1,4-benzoquinol methylase
MSEAIKAFYERKYTQGAEIARTSKDYTLACVPDGRGRDALDVGCGSGANSLALAAKGYNVHGVDVSDAAIAQYRAHGFDGVAADIEAGIGYADAQFDLVFCSEVIEHMTSPEVLAGEMSRVLKPGGHLVLSTPNSAFWLYRVLGIFGFTPSELQHPKHFQFFSRRSLLRLLRDAGFDVQAVMGRNMYCVLPVLPGRVAGIASLLGFKRESRFRTGSHFWHLSSKSTLWNSLFADTLIVLMTKPLS